MTIPSEQIDSAALGACIALRFLFHSKQRRVSRAQLPDLTDSAIFHRLWELFGLNDPIVCSQLLPEEQIALAAFAKRFDELPWEPLVEYPHISELQGNDLSTLKELGRHLYNLLVRRRKLPLWRRITLRLQGW